MLELIWEVAGGPILAIGLVGVVLLLFGARRVTALAHLAARSTVGEAARAAADPLAGKSFDERVAARLKELEQERGQGEPDAGIARHGPAPRDRVQPAFGRRSPSLPDKPEHTS